jgi:hypothetical protein
MHRWKRLFLAVLIVSITFLFPLLAPTPHRIDRAHADLIVQGMTKDQVEAIFGVPAGAYDWAEPDSLSPFMTWFDFDGDGFADVLVHRNGGGPTLSPVLVWTPRRTSLTWISRHGSFTVWFDINENVVTTNAVTEVRIVPPWQRWWNRYWKK